MSDDFVSVYHAMDEYTANIIKAALEDAGIPAFVHPIESSAYGSNIFVSVEGVWGYVLVSAENRERAMAVLEEYNEKGSEVVQ